MTIDHTMVTVENIAQQPTEPTTAAAEVEKPPLTKADLTEVVLTNTENMTDQETNTAADNTEANTQNTDT